MSAYYVRVETHVLQARTADGRTIEIGRVRSLELAARLQRSLIDCLWSEYPAFEILERDVEPATVRAVTVDEVRRALAN